MDTIHIKSLEEHNPGYKDRNLIWCKVYFKMINADPNFEMLCEIDKWRFIALVMLELQIKQPIPLDVEYLKRKGFDFKKRAMSLTIQMLHNLVEVRNETVTQIRVDKSRVEEEKSRNKVELRNEYFNEFWSLYPKKVGKGGAEKSFLKVNPSEELFTRILSAVSEQKLSSQWKREDGRYIPNPATWLNQKRWGDELKAGESPVSKKTKLFPISGKKCSECALPAVYKDTSGSYDFYYCVKHMPEAVKELYE